MRMSYGELKRQIFAIEPVNPGFDTYSNERVIADALLAARSEARLSRMDVAKRMRIAPSVVARMESGSHLPSFSSLERYATAVGQSIKLEIRPVRQVA